MTKRYILTGLILLISINLYSCGKGEKTMTKWMIASSDNILSYEKKLQVKSTLSNNEQTNLNQIDKLENRMEIVTGMSFRIDDRISINMPSTKNVSHLKTASKFLQRYISAVTTFFERYPEIKTDEIETQRKIVARKAVVAQKHLERVKKILLQNSTCEE